jgi:hypothetical protein
VAFSPDGSLIAANDWSGHIEIWEANAPTAADRDAARVTDRARTFGWHIEQAALRWLRGDPTKADFHLEQIRDEMPPGAPLMIAQAELERRRGRIPIADSILTRWLDGHTADVEVLLRRADLSARLGRWPRTVDDLARAIAVEPDDERAWLLGAAALIHLGDTDGHRRHCREILRRFGEATGKLAHEIALACLLSPEAPLDEPAFRRLLARCAAPGGPRPSHWDVAISVLSDIRIGRSESVIALWPTALNHVSPEDGHFQILIPFLEALAHARAVPTDRERARRSLEPAVSALGRQRDSAGGDPASCWIWLSCDSIRQEIESLIREVSLPADPFSSGPRKDP